MFNINKCLLSEIELCVACMGYYSALCLEYCILLFVIVFSIISNVLYLLSSVDIFMFCTLVIGMCLRGDILDRLAEKILITYLLIPWSRVLLEKPTGFQLVEKFPTFYGTRKFITAFTSARHLSLS